MKNFNLLALATVFSLVLSSCSSNEELLPQETSTDLLKSYTVKRDKNGSYSLDYRLSDNAIAQNNKNIKSNTNEVYLYSSDNRLSARNESQGLSIENNKLKVGFVDTNSGRTPQIIVEDENIVMSRDSSDDRLLDDYSITGNEDGTYDLVFNVKNKVEVDFVFNEEENVYEIHLEKVNGTESNFERTFTKDEGVDLKIAFVNHFQTGTFASRTNTASVAATTTIPNIIIQ